MLGTAIGLLLTTSCINEDLSECGSYCDLHFRFTSELSMEQVVTDNLSSSVAEQEMARQLIEKFNPVFSGEIHHLEVPFFESESRSIAHHETIEAGGAKEVSYSLYLPQGVYHHLPVANAMVDSMFSISGHHHLDNYSMFAMQRDTLESLTAGIYQASQQIECDGTDQNIHIPLGMVNSAVALVLSPAVDSVESYIVNTAVGYSFADSTYDFSSSTAVRTSNVITDDMVASYGVCLPSKAEESVQRATSSDTEYWQMHVYVTRGGKTTRNVLSVREPLAAGEPKILKATISDDGEIIYHGAEVSVSVTLDWKPGGDHDIEI